MSRPITTVIGAAVVALTSLDAQHRDHPRAALSLTTSDVAAFADSYFDARMKAASIPGAVFVFVKDGKVLYERGYGFSNLETRTPVDPERTVFRVGSVSKSVTAIAVMQLVEAGLIDLDADANRYLRRLKIPSTFSSPVTVRHLLSHTAGFEERLFGQHTRTRAGWLPLEGFLARHLADRVRPSGEVISYNDFGTSLAGLVVQDVSRMPFAEYVRRFVFAPLGMTRSSFRVESLPPEIARDLATSYRLTGDGFSPYEYDYIMTPPAAGLVSTAADMGRLMIALLDSGRAAETRFLRPETTGQLLSRQFGHEPELPGRGFDFAESRENGISGWYKDGQATGFTARVFVAPEKRVGWFVAINRSVIEAGGGFNAANRVRRDLTSAILDRYFPTDTTLPVHRAPVRRPRRADRVLLAGTYRDVVGSSHTLEKLITMFNEVHVEESADGTLDIDGTTWAETRPLVLQYVEGGPFFVAFRAGTDGRASYFFQGGGAYERIPLHETSRFTIRAALVFIGVFVVSIIVWLVALLGRGESRRSRWRSVVGATSLINLIFLVALGTILMRTDPQRFFQGVPLSLRMSLVLPLIGTVGAAVALLLGAQALRAKEGSPIARGWYALASLGLLAFPFFLATWNLFGFRY